MVSALNAVLASFSIFAALLLNLLLLVYTRAGEEGKTRHLFGERQQFIRELSENIEFAVLVSVFVVICSLIAVVTSKVDPGKAPHASLTMSVILAYLTSIFS